MPNFWAVPAGGGRERLDRSRRCLEDHPMTWIPCVFVAMVPKFRTSKWPKCMAFFNGGSLLFTYKSWDDFFKCWIWRSISWCRSRMIWWVIQHSITIYVFKCIILTPEVSEVYLILHLKINHQVKFGRFLTWNTINLNFRGVVTVIPRFFWSLT